MPRFCANLTLLFADVPMVERFALAKAAGFAAVEILFPYDEAVPELVDQMSFNGLQMVLINCPPPNYTGGPRGFAAVPGAQARFQQDFRRVLRYAKALNVQHVHIMSGVAAGQAARDTLIANLRWAADFAPKQSLTLEPLNPDDMPGYYLNDFHLAHDIIAAVDRPNLGLQFDTYHAQRIHGDVQGVWDAVKDQVVHVQVGQAPDRSEPIGGPVDFPAFYDRIAADGYDGWISAEYHPKAMTLDGLGWLAKAQKL